MEDVHTFKQPEKVAFAEIVQAALGVVQSSRPSALPVELDLEDDLPLVMLERTPMTCLLAGLLTRALSATVSGCVTIEARCLHGRGGIGQGDWLWASVRGAPHSFSEMNAEIPETISWTACQEIVMRHRGRIWIAEAVNASAANEPDASGESAAAVFMLPIWTV
ncbi:MAG: hypothetical protein JXA21_28750 [Anaerolineae bacterium]|nr:hypothetical protein [Anaerolineae bacterium]